MHLLLKCFFESSFYLSTYLKRHENVFKAVVVAQLVERSLPILEVRSLNPVIGKNLFGHLLSTVFKRRKKENEAGNAPLKNIMCCLSLGLVTSC